MISLSFFAAALILSFSISLVTEAALEYIEDAEGDPEDQVLMTVVRSSAESRKEEEISSFLNTLAFYGELQLSTVVMPGSLPSGKVIGLYVVPIAMEKQRGWHVPLLSGRYFKKEDMKDSRIQVLLGKDMAEAYHVSIHDEQLFIPVWDYTEIDPSYLNNNHYSITLKSGKEVFLKDWETMKDDPAFQDLRIYFADIEKRSNMNLLIEKRNALTSGALIYLIAILNIVNLMIFRMSERKRDISVLKALGASKRLLKQAFFLEILIISLFGCLAALLVQWIISKAFDNYLITKEFCCRLTFQNILISSAASLLAGMAASILPLHRALSMPVSEGIKQG